MDDENVEDDKHGERKERVDAGVDPRPNVNVEEAVGHVQSS